MENLELNLQNLECVKKINNIGSTIYVDMCSGVRQVLEWGSIDWILFTIVGVFIIFVFIILVIK